MTASESAPRHGSERILRNPRSNSDRNAFSYDATGRTYRRTLLLRAGGRRVRVIRRRQLPQRLRKPAFDTASMITRGPVSAQRDTRSGHFDGHPRRDAMPLVQMQVRYSPTQCSTLASPSGFSQDTCRRRCQYGHGEKYGSPRARSSCSEGCSTIADECSHEGSREE